LIFTFADADDLWSVGSSQRFAFFWNSLVIFSQIFSQFLTFCWTVCILIKQLPYVKEFLHCHDLFGEYQLAHI